LIIENWLFDIDYFLISNTEYRIINIHRTDGIDFRFYKRFARRCEFTERGCWDIEKLFLFDYWMLVYSMTLFTFHFYLLTLKTEYWIINIHQKYPILNTEWSISIGHKWALQFVDYWILAYSILDIF